jgi:hypothetical protein
MRIDLSTTVRYIFTWCNNVRGMFTSTPSQLWSGLAGPSKRQIALASRDNADSKCHDKRNDAPGSRQTTECHRSLIARHTSYSSRRKSTPTGKCSVQNGSNAVYSTSDEICILDDLIGWYLKVATFYTFYTHPSL